MARPTNEERIKKLEEQNSKMLEALAAAKKEKEEIQTAVKKEKDPMSGPGELCQATKVTKSESWQLQSRARTNPATGTEEMITDPAPQGFTKREGPNNTFYVISKDHEDRTQYPRLEDVVIPNCRSKYTREYTVYGKKPIQDSGDFTKEPPKVPVHLCEKHAKLFGAKEVEKNAKRERV